MRTHKKELSGQESKRLAQEPIALLPNSTSLRSQLKLTSRMVLKRKKKVVMI